MRRRGARRARFAGRAVYALGALCLSPAHSTYAGDARPTSRGGAVPAEYDGLHNVLSVGNELINGSAPEGDTGFDSLRRMGIKTLICVDGGAPDVERAAARGIRCVHLPIGYDGIESEQGLKLMRAVRDLPKPIYLHCLHGKHRSPAAVGAIMVGLGRMTADEATGFLHKAGTSTKYKGLYEAVRTASKVQDARLDAVLGDFPEKAPVTSLVQSMVDIGHAFEHLEKLEKAGWEAPADHPDLDARNESRILLRLLGQLGQEASMKGRPAAFQSMLRSSETSAGSLSDSVAQGQRDQSSQGLSEVRASCLACHERFRD